MIVLFCFLASFPMGVAGFGILSQPASQPLLSTKSSSSPARALGATMAPPDDSRLGPFLPFWGLGSTSTSTSSSQNSAGPTMRPFAFRTDPLDHWQSLWGKSMTAAAATTASVEPEINTSTSSSPVAEALDTLQTLWKAVAPKMIVPEQLSWSPFDNKPEAIDGHWAAYWDPRTKLHYYYNRRTGASRWKAPFGTFGHLKQQQQQQPLHKAGPWEAYCFTNDDDINDNMVYYYNRATKVSTWERPRHFPVLKDQQEQSSTIPKSVAAQGDWAAYPGDAAFSKTNSEYYYFNHVTGVSQWDPPTANFPVTALGSGVSSSSSSSSSRTEKKQKQQKQPRHASSFAAPRLQHLSSSNVDHKQPPQQHPAAMTRASFASPGWMSEFSIWTESPFAQVVSKSRSSPVASPKPNDPTKQQPIDLFTQPLMKSFCQLQQNALAVAAASFAPHVTHTNAPVLDKNAHDVFLEYVLQPVGALLAESTKGVLIAALDFMSHSLAKSLDETPELRRRSSPSARHREAVPVKTSLLLESNKNYKSDTVDTPSRRCLPDIADHHHHPSRSEATDDIAPVTAAVGNANSHPTVETMDDIPHLSYWMENSDGSITYMARRDGTDPLPSVITNLPARAGVKKVARIESIPYQLV
jgi:hypothetical protein